MTKILIIDIETTALSPREGGIAEVGIVELDLSTGERKILFDRVCKEKRMTLMHIENSWIVSNGYMDAQEIYNADLLDDMKEEIQSIINKYPDGATAYNNSFDFRFLQYKGISIPKKLPCPMRLSTNICQIGWSDYHQSYKWPNCEEAYNFYFPNEDFEEKHRGADDAFHEAKIVYELYNRGVFKLN